jgi:hypothetical protein
VRSLASHWRRKESEGERERERGREGERERGREGEREREREREREERLGEIDRERERERENVTLIVASSRRKLLIQLCSASVGQCGPQHYWFGYTHDAFRSFYIPGWEPYMPSCLVHTVV